MARHKSTNKVHLDEIPQDSDSSLTFLGTIYKDLPVPVISPSKFPQFSATSSNFPHPNITPTKINSYEGFSAMKHSSSFHNNLCDQENEQLQRFDFSSSSGPLTIKFSVNNETPSTFIKRQKANLCTSSPTKFLQSYLDGSNSLISMPHPFSSNPSSLDSQNHQFLLQSTSRPLSGVIERRQGSKLKISSSSECSNIEFTSEDSLSCSKSSISLAVKYEVPANVKPLKRGRRAGEKRPEELNISFTKRKDNLLSSKIDTTAIISPYSPNRPKRNVKRPSNYFKENRPDSPVSSSDDSLPDTKRSKPSFPPEMGRNPKRRNSKSQDVKVSHLSFRSTGSRSKSGCWTCRLRRKKCSEDKPECKDCLRLGLACDNSDQPRPEYMNDKKIAKKKMDEIKAITIMKKKIRMSGLKRR